MADAPTQAGLMLESVCGLQPCLVFVISSNFCVEHDIKVNQSDYEIIVWTSTTLIENVVSETVLSKSTVEVLGQNNNFIFLKLVNKQLDRYAFLPS